ncbi:hypothetical protein AAEX28_05645 [Lentisphaerota bacterium WC36G]|nr:hypothetical protein LJT99_08505 [Lentisphaerae bacterium WC36]
MNYLRHIISLQNKLKLLFLIATLFLIPSTQAIQNKVQKNTSNNKLTICLEECQLDSGLMFDLAKILYSENKLTTEYQKHQKNNTFDTDIIISDKILSNATAKNYVLELTLRKPILITVNENNAIRAISSDNLSKAILGKIQHWSDLSNSKIILPKNKINAYCAPKDSFLMKKIFNSELDKDIKEYGRFTSLDDEEQVIQISQIDPNALSLTTIGNLNDKVKVIKLDGIQPFKEENSQAILNNDYKFTLEFYFYKKKGINPKASKFFSIFKDKKNSLLIQQKFNYFIVKKSLIKKEKQQLKINVNKTTNKDKK